MSVTNNSFSELPSQGRTRNTKYWYSWVQTIYYDKKTPAQEPTPLNCWMTRSLYQVPYFELTVLHSETRVTTSVVRERKEAKCHDWSLEKNNINVTGQGQPLRLNRMESAVL